MTRLSGVGIFGGTFNPVHVGHLRAAEEVAEALNLERVLFVPSAMPPHKSASPEDPIAPARDRLAWVRAAVADNPRLGVDDLEVERGGPSFAAETLRALGRRTAPEKPIFIIGHDAFVEIATWREPESLLTLAHFAVTTRPPVARGSLAEWLPALFHDAVDFAPDGLSARHRTAGTWIRLIEISLLDVSSSKLRANLREGRSVRYLIPEVVVRSIEQSGAYAGARRQANRA
jgi:nicotinate-nucleotide adenylyltransferase